MRYHIYQSLPRPDRLAQGDVLSAQNLVPVLRGHQDYFAEGEHFTGYAVLTQSCDLQPEQKISDYICLAVVRRLSDVLGRRNVESGKAREKTQDLLEALYLHNHYIRGLFFLPASPQNGLPVDSVIDLRVVLSVHKMHYQSLLSARLTSMTDLYAAKLGFLFGHLFNRVATPGWSEIYADENTFIKLKEFAKRAIQKIQRDEDANFSKLVQENGATCSESACEATAKTYRWNPYRDHGGKAASKEILLCDAHAEQFDIDMSHKALKRAPDRR